MTTIRINSIFESISGEAGPGFPQGAWCTFIRFQGCDLSPHCRWCDTEYAQDFVGGVDMTIRTILFQIATEKVLITGGEPLAQVAGVRLLMDALQSAGHVVQVETNGAHPLAYAPDVFWVVDYKCPSSGASDQMQVWEDQPPWMLVNTAFKFVVSNGTDVSFALVKMQNLAKIMPEPNFIISPVDANGSKITWVRDQIHAFDPTLLDHVTFSIQLHKITGMP